MILVMGDENGGDFSRLFEQGLEAGRRRDYRQAAEIFARVAGGSGRHPQALLYLGRSWHALGEHDRAARALAGYCRRRPRSATGRLFLGRSLLARGDAPGAVRQLSEAVRLRPQLSPAHGLLGVACLRARKFDAALACFAEALRLEPGSVRLENAWLNAALVSAVRLFYRGRLVDSARLFSSVLDRRGSSIVAHVYLARIYRDLSRDALALLHLERAIALSPVDPALKLQRAAVLLTLGRSGEALAELKAVASLAGDPSLSAQRTPEQIQRLLAVSLFAQHRYREAAFQAVRVLRLDGNDAQMHALTAESYRALGDLQKARNHFQRALERDRQSLAPRYGLLAVFHALGAWEELEGESRRILRLDPQDSTALYFRCLALAQRAPGAPDTLKALQEQVRSRGPDPALMMALGDSYEKAGLADLAEGWYARTLKVSPEHEGALRALAGIYENAERAEEMEGVFRRVLAVRPDDRDLRRKLVRSLLGRQLWEEAIPELESLLARDSRAMALRTALSHCYRRTGRFADALVILRDIIAERPGSEEPVKAAVFCLDKLGLRANAIGLAERFQRDYGERVDLALAAGVLQYRDGGLEKAAEAFRRAASIAPSEWRAWRNLGMVYRKMGVEEFARKFLAKAERCRMEGALKGSSPGDTVSKG